MRLVKSASRLAGLAAAFLILSGSIIAVNSATAVAKAACNHASPTADVAVSQAFSALSNGDTLLHVVVSNNGPCNIPDAELDDTLPAGATFVSASSLPSSWRCSASGTAVTCLETATIGVPGSHDIFIEYTPGTGTTNIASAHTFPDGPVDPFLDNNTSYGGFLPNGGTVIYGPSGNPLPTPDSGFGQTTIVTLPPVGPTSVDILELSTTSSFVGCQGIPNCFGKLVTITAPATTQRWTKTFKFLASGVPVALANIVVWSHSSSSTTFVQVPPCDANLLPDPCIQQRAEFIVDGVDYFGIIVTGFGDDSWGFD